MRKLGVIGIVVLALMLASVSGVGAQDSSGGTGTQPQAPIIIGTSIFERAGAALSAGAYDQAARDFTLLILLNPTFSQGYYGRALSYASLGDFERAMPDIDRALTTAPPNIGYREGLYLLLAEIHVQQDDLEAAIGDYTSIIELNPSADNYAQRALYSLGLNKFDDAERDLTEALDLQFAAAEADSEQAVNPRLYAFRAYARGQIDQVENAASDWLNYMALIGANVVDHDPLIPGDLQVVALSEGIVHRFPIEGEAGQRFTAAAGGARGTDTDPVIVLISPEGAPLIADDDSGGGTISLIFEYELPADGEYLLLVSHSLGNPNGNVGVQMQLDG